MEAPEILSRIKRHNPKMYARLMKLPEAGRNQAVMVMMNLRCKIEQRKTSH